MRYDHVVNYNGVYYNAGEDVPDNVKGEKNTKKTEGDNKPLPSENTTDEHSDSEIVLETSDTYYTEEDLQNMTVKQIKQIAEEKGIEINSTMRADVVAEFLEKQG